MEKNKSIRALTTDELEPALGLVWAVFTQCEAPLCGDEGTREFWSFIDYEYMVQRVGDGVMRFWGAFDGENLVGVVAMRELMHISLLFVLPSYQRQGVATNLLKKALLDCRELDPTISRVTVNASQGGAEFYNALGFVPFGEEQEQSGLRFTPMELHGKATQKA